MAGGKGALFSFHMEDTFPLRQAVLAWLEQARDLPSIPQAITDVALSTQPEFDAVVNAVVGAAPKSEHRHRPRGDAGISRSPTRERLCILQSRIKPIVPPATQP
ncbi:hypothetical protein [Streptomyces harbinensis]|uniref:hypothetical protein n=1 Tax=Streptomyces harbinensis TaxID=1176198 RepID=UPI0034E01A47